VQWAPLVHGPRPIATRAVTFQNGPVTIAGTLSLPAGAGPFPAVVPLSGSGPQDRDSDMLGFKPFKLIAESFMLRGIAVLRCDVAASVDRPHDCRLNN
jgi:hypothetical protein